MPRLTAAEPSSLPDSEQLWLPAEGLEPMAVLRSPSPAEAHMAFAKCHRLISKTEKISPQAAFMGFSKILLVKLAEDQRLHSESRRGQSATGELSLPATALRFSTKWIEAQATRSSHPVADWLYPEALRRFRLDDGTALVPADGPEPFELSPETTRRSVSELEHLLLFGMADDLNGRLFEIFLDATLRGKDLGQYFTPRSVVRLMTDIVHPKAGAESTDRVLDGCCGTGGFLLESLTHMRSQVAAGNELSQTQQERIRATISESVVGIDACRIPPIAAIARSNLTIHGGGSHVFAFDALDPEDQENTVGDLRGGPLFGQATFDVVLTNPPFSMEYKASDPKERAILENYSIARDAHGRLRSSCKSSALFIEFYARMLRPGGRMATVIDDSLLSGQSYATVRAYILEQFVVKAIISLHGDAFQRAGARVKTSILVLERREQASVQGSVFVYECAYLGREERRWEDDTGMQSDLELELTEVAAAYDDFDGGDHEVWGVPSESITDRLDAKYLRPWSTAKIADQWRHQGIDVVELRDLVQPASDMIEIDPHAQCSFIRITYAGTVEHGAGRLGADIGYARMRTARIGDIVVSNIGAVHGSIGVITDDTTHLLISDEYTILRPIAEKQVDSHYLCAILRTPAIIAEWLSSASGIARQRVDWEAMQHQLVPLVVPAAQEQIGGKNRSAALCRQQALELEQEAMHALVGYGLFGEEPRQRIDRAMPPR